MGLFDFFSKKEETPTPQPTQVRSNGNISIVALAKRLNEEYVCGNPKVAGNLAAQLANEVSPRRQGGRALLNLSSQECQPVGLAFAKNALCWDWGDEDLNSVAAENAYYCLARNLIETGNTFVAPALFTILFKGARLMKDKLIDSWSDMAQKEVGMPIGIMLGGNPYTAPHLSEFREQAIGFKDNIMYYLLQQFYNIEKGTYTIPTDLPFMIPSKNEIHSFLNAIEDEAKSEGKKHFESVYHCCEDTLTKF